MTDWLLSLPLELAFPMFAKWLPTAELLVHVPPLYLRVILLEMSRDVKAVTQIAALVNHPRVRKGENWSLLCPQSNVEIAKYLF